VGDSDVHPPLLHDRHGLVLGILRFAGGVVLDRLGAHGDADQVGRRGAARLGLAVTGAEVDRHAEADRAALSVVGADPGRVVGVLLAVVADAGVLRESVLRDSHLCALLPGVGDAVHVRLVGVVERLLCVGDLGALEILAEIGERVLGSLLALLLLFVLGFLLLGLRVARSLHVGRGLLAPLGGRAHGGQRGTLDLNRIDAVAGELGAGDLAGQRLGVGDGLHALGDGGIGALLALLLHVLGQLLGLGLRGLGLVLGLRGFRLGVGGPLAQAVDGRLDQLSGSLVGDLDSRPVIENDLMHSDSLLGLSVEQTGVAPSSRPVDERDAIDADGALPELARFARIANALPWYVFVCVAGGHLDLAGLDGLDGLGVFDEQVDHDEIAVLAAGADGMPSDDALERFGGDQVAGVLNRHVGVVVAR